MSVSVSIVLLFEPLIVPVILTFPVTDKLSVGDAVPIPTFPVLLMTNGVASGLVESSITKAFPVPV